MCTEELRAQNETRFLRGRQIASMIYELFRATGANDAAQGLSDLFQALLSASVVKWSWKVCTSQIHKILFSFRRHWLCMDKKLLELRHCCRCPTQTYMAAPRKKDHGFLTLRSSATGHLTVRETSCRAQPQLRVTPIKTGTSSEVGRRREVNATVGRRNSASL